MRVFNCVTLFCVVLFCMTACVSAFKLSAVLKSVSYTHLDVYKRQPPYWFNVEEIYYKTFVGTCKTMGFKLPGKFGDTAFEIILSCFCHHADVYKRQWVLSTILYMIILTNLHQLTIWMQTVWMRFKRGIILWSLIMTLNINKFANILNTLLDIESLLKR